MNKPYYNPYNSSMLGTNAMFKNIAYDWYACFKWD